MRVEQQFSRKDVEELVGGIIDKQINSTIQVLDKIGSKATTEQRLKADGMDYIDRTGNLRSSVGYIVRDSDKELKHGGFAHTPQGSEGGVKGQLQGLSYAREEAVKSRNRGLRLVVVAGMDYAGALSAKGYDVLDTAELTADKMMNDIRRNGI